MIRRIAVLSAFALCLPTLVSAQEADLITLPQIAPEEVSKALLGAPLRTPEETYAITSDPAYDITDDESLFVVEGGTVKNADSWSAADSEACKSSGGIELPISAGRIACFKL